MRMFGLFLIGLFAESFSVALSLISMKHLTRRPQPSFTTLQLFSNLQLQVFSCDQQLSLSRLVHKNSPVFGSHSFRPRRLKFGMEIKFVCVCVCVCVCVHTSWLKGGVVVGVAYRKKAHWFTDLHKFKGLSQMTANNLSRPTGKSGAWQWEWSVK